MSDRRRRKRYREPNRTATRKSYVSPPPKLRLVIATSPGSDSVGPTLAGDLQLVRSALLYADEVELVSPTAEMIGSVVALGSGSKQDVLSLFTSLDDATLSMLGMDVDALPEWRNALQQFSALTPELLEAMSHVEGVDIPAEVLEASSQLQGGLAQALSEFAEVGERILRDSGADELLPALESGLLKLSPLLITGGDTDDMIANYIDRLRGILGNPRVHLLLDDLMASIVRGLIEEEGLEPGHLSLANAGEAAVGSGLIARLPAFNETPVDELLDLRADLLDPLSRYRRSVADMANRLRVGPFDEALAADIDHLYLVEVGPAITDLRSGLADHGLVREAAKHLSTDIKALVFGTVGPTVAMASASAAHLSTWVTAAAATSPLAAALGQSLVSGVAVRDERQAELKRHDLFYLYELDHKTRDGK